MKLRPEVRQAMLDELKRVFDESTGGEQSRAIFRAIDFCGEQELLMPEWVWLGFGQRLAKRYAMDVGSLDEAFEWKTITPGRLANDQRNKFLKFEILNRVSGLQAQNKPIPWDALAQELGASKTKIQTLYYDGQLLTSISNSDIQRVYELLLEPFSKKR